MSSFPSDISSPLPSGVRSTTVREDPALPPAVAVKNLTFAHNCEPVLESIDLTVRQGDFLAVIGPNGGGKTTLLRLMLGLLPPQTGTVAIFGDTPARMSRHIGYVPQFSTMQLEFPASVLDMVLMGAARTSFRGGSWSKNKEAKEKALTQLETLGLGAVIREPVSSLSGGQRQRALVARALMGRPDEETAPFLLLLDEPTASIDPQGKFCFYEFLEQLRGIVTIIVVSHDLFMASPFFNSLAFVNRTLTPLPGNQLTPGNLVALFGQHMHSCPVADFQHASGLYHPDGCTHQHCSGPEHKGQ